MFKWKEYHKNKLEVTQQLPDNYDLCSRNKQLLMSETSNGINYDINHTRLNAWNIFFIFSLISGLSYLEPKAIT